MLLESWQLTTLLGAVHVRASKRHRVDRGAQIGGFCRRGRDLDAVCGPACTPGSCQAGQQPPAGCRRRGRGPLGLQRFSSRHRRRTLRPAGRSRRPLAGPGDAHERKAIAQRRRETGPETRWWSGPWRIGLRGSRCRRFPAAGPGPMGRRGTKRPPSPFR